jgi:hypothetical protein
MWAPLHAILSQLHDEPHQLEAYWRHQDGLAEVLVTLGNLADALTGVWR